MPILKFKMTLSKNIQNGIKPKYFFLRALSPDVCFQIRTTFLLMPFFRQITRLGHGERTFGKIRKIQSKHYHSIKTLFIKSILYEQMRNFIWRFDKYSSLTFIESLSQGKVIILIPLVRVAPTVALRSIMKFHLSPLDKNPLYGPAKKFFIP